MNKFDTTIREYVAKLKDLESKNRRLTDANEQQQEKIEQLEASIEKYIHDIMELDK